MTQTPNNALGHYRATDTYGAAAGDRLQLITRMLQGAMDRVATARGHMTRDEVAEKGEQIGKAIGLIDGLRTCLDTEKGGVVAANLDQLYRYMLSLLMDASLKNDVAALDEVIELLGEVKSGWDQMAADHKPEVTPESSAAPMTA